MTIISFSFLFLVLLLLMMLVDVLINLIGFDKFVNETLSGETLTKPCQKELIRLKSDLNTFYVDYEYFDPSSTAPFVGNSEGSGGSIKSSTPAEESRNTTGSGGHGSISEDDTSYADNIPCATLKDLTDAFKKGWLHKKSEMFLKIKRPKLVYCAIHKNIMYWFKKPTDKKQEGSFFVTGYELKATGQSDGIKKDFVFDLICAGKKKYQFVAESEKVMNEWKIAVLKASKYPEEVTVEESVDDMEDGDLYEPLAEPTAGHMEDKAAAIPESQSDAPTADETYDACETPLRSAAHSQLPPLQHAKTPLPEPQEPVADDIYEPLDNSVETNGLSADGRFPKVPQVPPHKKTLTTAAQPPLPRRGHQPLPTPPSGGVPQLPPRNKNLAVQVENLREEDFENLFYGLWNCVASTPNELNFSKGDIIHIINRELEAEHWWIGELAGKIGLVPKGFLTPAYEEVA